MRKTFYEKRGRRYIPVYEYDSELLDSMPHGAHLVVVEPGSKYTRFNVKAWQAPLIAAIHKHREELLAELRAWSEPRPARMLNKREQDAYAAWRRIMRDEDAPFSMTRESAAGLIDKLEARLVEMATKEML